MLHAVRCVSGILLLSLLSVPHPVSADPASAAGGSGPASESTAHGGPIRFEEAASGLSAVFPVQLTGMDQVAQNSYNWKGPQDASMRCDIGFAPAAVVIRGEFRDDLPFFQTMQHPAMPEWWGIQYGADGLEFLLDDPTSATRRVRFVLNFGSGAVNPQVELLSAPQPHSPGFIPQAVLDLEDAPGTAPEEGTIQFRAAIPYSALAETDFFRGPLRITVRLHDLDGDYTTYLMMQQAIEKK